MNAEARSKVFLVVCSAGLFARRPTRPAVAPLVIGVLIMPTAFVAFLLFGVIAWASTCNP